MHLLQFFHPEMGSLAFRSQGAETKKLVGGNPSVLTKGRRAVAVAKFWEGARSGHYNCRKILAPSVPTISEITGIWQERAPKERESERNECAGREFAVFGVRLWGRSTSLSVCCAPRTNIELADVRVRERNARRQTKRKGTLGNARKRNGSATAPAFLLFCAFGLIKCRESVNGSPEIGQLSRAVARKRSLRKIMKCLPSVAAVWLRVFLERPGNVHQLF